MDDEQHAADPTSDHGSAILVPATAAKQKQQDDNNQNNVHVTSGLRPPLFRLVSLATGHFRKLGDGNPEALNRFHDVG
jgi:hypothetical protein